MSAWIVTKAHIDVLVHALGRRELMDISPNEAGAILWRENYRSVNYRYDERSRTPSYTYSQPPVKWSPDQLTKIVGCYTYQTCERPDWEQSKAFALVETLSEALDREGAKRDSAEADTAPWGVCECGGDHERYAHDAAMAEQGVEA